MYNVLKDSLIAPKNLLKYRNKSGWYVFFYLVLLTAFVSIGAFVYYLKLPNPALITSEETFCTYELGVLTCEGNDYNPSTEYSIYGYPVYFLNSNSNITDIGIMPSQSMVFSESSLSFYMENRLVQSISILDISNEYGFTGTMIFIGKIILTMSLILSFFGNMAMLMFVALISTLPFMRLKKIISYKKILKLVIFAISPFAVLMTFYNLINFDDLWFFILMLIAYRSVFMLQRELYYQTYQHLGSFEGLSKPSRQPEDDDVSEYTDYEVTETEEETEEEEKEE